ncbi:MAG: 50S ribosomal protein L4 [Candidatus Paceibacteria bacterium]
MATAKKTTTKKPAVKKTPAKKAASKKTAKPAAKKAVASSGALTLPVYDASGKEVRTLTLPENLFAAGRNDALLYQAVTAMEANARTPIAHAKDRSAVRGGGRKPWKQKGTGRARHGSRRSPIWKGGGVTHGPLKNKDYSKKLNKKMRAKALALALSEKARDGSVMLVDTLTFAEPKTKEAKALLAGLSKVKGFEALSTRRNNAALVALGEANAAVKKSFSNMGNVFVEESRNLNPVDVLSYRLLVIANPEATFEALGKRMEK